MREIERNEEQERAIAHIYGPSILISCPGSGKTTTLLRRIHKMIETGINPSKILMLTFTKAAADEMGKKYFKSTVKIAELHFAQSMHCVFVFCTIMPGYQEIVL